MGIGCLRLGVRVSTSHHCADTSKPRSNPQPNPDLLVKIGSHNAVRDKLPFRNWKEGPADGKPASRDGAPNDGTVANGQEVRNLLVCNFL